MRRRQALAVLGVGALAGCVAPAAEPGDGPDPTPPVTEVTFTAVDADVERPATIEADAGRLVAEGILTGRNSCYVVDLGQAGYTDGADPAFEVVVEAEEDSAEDEACLPVLVELGYRLWVSFEDGSLPARAVVYHDEGEGPVRVADWER